METSAGGHALPRIADRRAWHIFELSYLHSRDVSYATFCEGEGAYPR
jgi:hypothetical protein